MQKIWLQAYPPEVAADIDSDRYPSLTALLEDAFQRYADRPAYVCMGATLRYAELDALSRQLAVWLQQQGLAPGARVAVMLPNVLQYPVAVAAILRAGMVVVNVNPLYTARELRHQLADSGAEAIVVLENFAATVQQVLAQTRVRHVLLASAGDMLGPLKGPLVNLVARRVRKLVPPFELPQAQRWPQALRAGQGGRLQPVKTAPGDLAFLQYTGGTTGVAKGAMLTHRNIVANVLQNDAWAGPALRDAGGDGVRIVCALPLYHILALTACMLMGAHWGACNILIPNPRDTAGMIRTLARQRFHFMPGVNTLFNALLNHPDVGRIDFSALRIALGGGMAVQQTVSERWQQLTGCPILEGYGLSETSPTATLNRTDARGFSGSIGLPVPSTEVAILDDDGRALPPGESGEIAIRGPQVMAGYWQRPDDTAQVMTADGFFRSGDIGVMDAQGYVRIVDRKKDMILVSGFNVYPSEVEAVVSAHPGVLECACIGVPDAHAGQAVKLFVVPRDATLDASQLQAYCREQLTAYKRPRSIVFCASLPKSNVGKILRRALREDGQG